MGEQKYRIYTVEVCRWKIQEQNSFLICLVLSGEADVYATGNSCHVCHDEIIVLNSKMSYKICSEKSAIFLVLEVNTDFFTAYYPKMEKNLFSFRALTMEDDILYKTIHYHMLSLAISNLEEEEYHELKAMADINFIFHELISGMSFHRALNTGSQNEENDDFRIRKIKNYIQDNYNSKVTMEMLAVETGLTKDYLSHFIKQKMGLTFQDYITMARCEKAIGMLDSNLSILDISIACGFSDPKYLTKGFQKFYGCTPKEYRKAILNSENYNWLSVENQIDMLSPFRSIIMLDRYFRSFYSIDSSFNVTYKPIGTKIGLEMNCINMC